MPRAITNPVFPPEIADADVARTDGYKEATSLEGYGTLVVTPERLAELVATALWEDKTPEGSV